MRISSRAIIIKDGKLLAMFRRKIKDGKVKEYFAIPGGGLEENETLEENVVRELKEEMNVDIKVLGYLAETMKNIIFMLKLLVERLLSAVKNSIA